MNAMEDDINGRQPQCKTTLMEQVWNTNKMSK